MADPDFIPDGDPDFIPDAPTAPGHADVVAPKVEAKPAGDDDTQHPGVIASTVLGALENSGAGPLARRAVAGFNAADNKLSGGDFNYSEQLAKLEQRRENASRENPAPYGVVGGTAGAYAGATLAYPAYVASNVINGALETPGGVGEKALGALGSGIEAAAFGKIAKNAPKVAAGLAGLFGGAGAYEAKEAGAPLGDVYANLTSAAPGVHAIGSGYAKTERQANDLAGLSADAAKDAAVATRDRQQKAGQTIAGGEQTASKSIEGQNKATDSANIARANATESAVKSDVRGEARDAAEQSSIALNKQRQTYNVARDAARAKAKAENDQRRLNQLDADEAYDKRMEQYEKDQGIRRQYLDSLTARNATVEKQAKTLRSIEKEKSRLEGEHKSQQERVLSDMKESLDGIDTENVPASIMGKIGEMFRETHTRLSNLRAGAERNGLVVPENYKDIDRYITETLIKNTPRKIAEFEEYKSDPKAWIEKQIAAAKAAEPKSPAETLPSAPPDFDKQARENVAQKAADEADLHERTRAAAEASVPPLPGAEPPEPVKPDRSAEEQAKRDWVRAKIKAGPTPLPPKVDGPQTAIDTTRARQATRAEEQRRVQEARSDPGLVLDKREPLRPADTSASMHDALADAMDVGRANVEKTLPKGQTVAGQFAAEQGTGRLRKMLASVAPTAGTAVGGYLGGGAGAVLGAETGKAAARRLDPETTKVLADFLKKAPSKADLPLGDKAPLRYKTPEEATHIYDEAAKARAMEAEIAKAAARRRAQAAFGHAGRLTPAVLEWIRRKREEESAR